MPEVTFRGGALDGLVCEAPDGKQFATSPGPCEVSSHYALEGGEFMFTGFGRDAAVMSKIIGQFRGESNRDREAIEAAMRPRSCRSCGRLYANAASYAVHFEAGPGSACIAGDDARGQLELVDGAYVIAGPRPAR